MDSDAKQTPTPEERLSQLIADLKVLLSIIRESKGYPAEER